MKSIKITIDGRTYNSLDEVPEEMRGKYTDFLQRAQNMMNGGGPFSVEGPLPCFAVEGDGEKHEVSFSTNESVININGTTYNNLENLPENVRRALAGFDNDVFKRAISGGNSPDPDKLPPTESFDETANDRQRIKNSLKYHPLEKKAPVDTKNLLATLAGIIALLLVAIFVVLLMHG